MGNGKLTNKDIFLKLLDVVEKNHESQKASAKAMESLATEMAHIRELLKSKLWWLVGALLIALLAAVGIKAAIPGVI